MADLELGGGGSVLVNRSTRAAAAAAAAAASATPSSTSTSVYLDGSTSSSSSGKPDNVASRAVARLMRFGGGAYSHDDINYGELLIVLLAVLLFGMVGRPFDYSLALALAFLAFVLLHPDNVLLARYCGMSDAAVLRCRSWSLVIVAFWSVLHLGRYMEHWRDMELRKVSSAWPAAFIMPALAATATAHWRTHWSVHAIHGFVALFTFWHSWLMYLALVPAAVVYSSNHLVLLAERRFERHLHQRAPPSPQPVLPPSSSLDEHEPAALGTSSSSPPSSSSPAATTEGASSSSTSTSSSSSSTSTCRFQTYNTREAMLCWLCVMALGFPLFALQAPAFHQPMPSSTRFWRDYPGTHAAHLPNSRAVLNHWRPHTARNFTVAYLGDSGADTQSAQILGFAARNSDLLVHLGDFDYINSPLLWDRMLRFSLGGAGAGRVLWTPGNHDLESWKLQLYEDVWFRNTNMTYVADHCVGQPMLRWVCTMGGVVHIGAAENLLRIGTERSHSRWFDQQLKRYLTAPWKVCVLHVVRSRFAPDGRTNRVSWAVFDTCRKHGALIVVAHSHSYARTLTLSAFSPAVLLWTTGGETPEPNGIVLSRHQRTTGLIVSGLGGGPPRMAKNESNVPFYWGGIGYATEKDTTDGGALFCTYSSLDSASCEFRVLNGTVLDSFQLVTDQS